MLDDASGQLQATDLKNKDGITTVFKPRVSMQAFTRLFAFQVLDHAWHAMRVGKATTSCLCLWKASADPELVPLRVTICCGTYQFELAVMS